MKKKVKIDSMNVLHAAMPVAGIRTETENLVRVLVSTLNVDEIQIGDSVDLIFTRHSGDLIYTGTIYRIDDRAEVMVSALGVEERRVEILIVPDVMSESFRSGFDVDVRFVTYFSENRMIVPRTAVFEDEGESMLYIVKNGSAVAVPVRLGTRLRTEVVVESGVSFGDVVIRNAGQDMLRNGSSVTY